MWAPVTKRNTVFLGGRSAPLLAFFQRAFATANPRQVPLSGPLSVQHGGRAHISGIVATVFGATGFLGRYVVSDLGSIGSQVVIPYRGDGENARHLKLAGDLGQIVPIPVNLWDDAALRRSVARSNVVVNLIGAKDETNNYSFHDAHVKTTHRIAKFAAEAGVERFIQMSTLAADRDSISKWVATKTESEEVARDFFPNSTILRLGPVFGPEDRFLNHIAELLWLAPAFPLVNGGKNKIQPIFCGDVSTAVMQAIVLPEAQGQIYHIGGDKVMTYRQLVDLVGEMIYRGDNTVELPHKAAQFIGKLSDKLLTTKRRRYTEDMANQMLIDSVVPEGQGVLTAHDLDVKLTPIEIQAAGQMLGQRGTRGSEILYQSPPAPYSLADK